MNRLRQLSHGISPFAQVRLLARENFENAHNEAEAAGQMNNCAARHYGAAMALAELGEDFELLKTIEKNNTRRTEHNDYNKN